MTTDVKGKTMTTGVKGKTKATGAKGKTKATDLKEFLSNLATDPWKLGEFLHAPEPVMSAANLSEADKTALRSGVSGMVAARLAGVSLDQEAGVSAAVRRVSTAAISGAAPVLPPVGCGMTNEANKAGALVIVGTGIRTVGQLTMEALAWMQRADEIIHLVADPVAEALIAGLKPGKEFTLQGFYSEGKPRAESYNEMIEFILSRVRAGVLVCGAFYGHPGVFAYPPHESIRRARAEGYAAWMLPGISVEDCLFADLGVDPIGGCQSYEATDFLINRRILDPSSQLILWQIGVLGHWTYRRSGYDLRSLPILLHKLLEHYPPTHEIVVYEAPIFPGCAPAITRIALAQLASVPLSGASTLYLPPARAANPDYRVLPYVPTNC
ncbi:MAG: hypothetical protein DME40_16095 [Verrucomicrobia bacterium]|nr:MAG: hypothetical protein DME40_16095 [Verrucomicrobiota bacterium]